MDSATKFDVIIIGAGLSGLTAALELQRQGKEVCILERLERIGGLCGTHFIDGHECVIACNDFGAGMQVLFKRFRIEQAFHHPRTKVFYRGRFYYTDPGPAQMLKGWRYAPQIARYLLKAFLPSLCRREEFYLEGLVNNTIKNPLLKDMLKLPAYLMGVKPSEFKTSMFREDIKYRYGYLNPTTPVGGPQAMVDKMARRFSEHGELRLGTEVLKVNNGLHLKRVLTSQGEFQAEHVINCTSEVQRDESIKPGLPISSYCLVLDRSFAYPQDVHTMVYYPPAPEHWFGLLDSGEAPEEFGFHLFRSDLKGTEQAYTANVYFYLPRHVDAPTEDQLRPFEQHIFSKLEEMLPGINAAIKQKTFISPQQFERTHGLSSRVTPVITPPGIRKPPNYDEEKDIYYAGNSHYPPGDHAGAAILSGIMAADGVARQQTAAK